MNNEYYKKYLKYKTKYLQLLKQSGGDPLTGTSGMLNKPIDSVKPWYDLSGHTLYCTSDLEGGAPFTNLRSTKGMASEKVTSALNNAFIIDTNGNITRLKPNTAFAFLGDLLDNQKFSIRLMERMINLKETSPKQVILLGGNRDFNKLRMGIELFLQTTEEKKGTQHQEVVRPTTRATFESKREWETSTTPGDKGLPWDKTTNMTELLDRLSNVKFEFRHVGVPDYLKDVLPAWNTEMSNIEKIYNDKTNISGRLKIMYDKTLGIRPGTSFMKQELNEMFNINLSNYSDEVVDKLFCVIHMVMAFDWSGVKLPGYLSRFNGLYQKYLTLCHVIAGFTLDKKVGILSHGSMPITASGKERTLTHPFGYDAKSPLFVESKETKFVSPKNSVPVPRTSLTQADTTQNRPKTSSEVERLRADIKPTAAIPKPLTPTQLEGLRTNVKPKQSSLLSVISMIELEKIELIKEYQQLRYMPYEYDKFPMVTKFIHLTALTKDSKYLQADSTYSPIVWSQPIDIDKLSDITLRLVGESKSELNGGAPGYENWINNDKPKSHHIVESGIDIVHYNIFGHQPLFFNPTYYRQDKTLHVNLDVSKIDGQANTSSFALLVINGMQTKLMGRITFSKVDKPLVFNNGVGYETEEIRAKLSDHDHYYHQIIPESGPVKLLKGDNIIGLPYKVTVDKSFNKTIG